MPGRLENWAGTLKNFPLPPPPLQILPILSSMMVAVAMLGVVVDADRLPRPEARESASWKVSSFSTMASSISGTGQINVVAVEEKDSGITPVVKSPTHPTERNTWTRGPRKKKTHNKKKHEAHSWKNPLLVT